MAVTITVRPSFAGKNPAKEQTAPEAEGSNELALTFDMPRLFIGRGEGSDLRLPDPSVSQRHASIRQRGSDYVIVDEGSTNGTALTQVMLAPQSPRILRSGDLVRVGRVWLEIKIDPLATARANPAAAKALALELVSRGLAAQGEESGPKLVVVSGPDAGKELTITEAGRRYVLGRAQDVDLPLDDAESAFRHIEVGLKGDHLVARDLGSKGATLAGSALAQADVAWRVGQELSFGRNVVVFQYPAAEALMELSRAADEPMRPGDAPPPPRDERDEGDEPEPTPTPETEDPDASHSRPIRAPRTEAVATDTGGWSLTDGVVLLFGAVVLVLSVVGFFWLIRR